MDKYKVTVGAKAYSFHDQSTGITICRGEEKELSARQYRTKKIQMALNSGHLRLVLFQLIDVIIGVFVDSFLIKNQTQVT